MATPFDQFLATKNDHSGHNERRLGEALAGRRDGQERRMTGTHLITEIPRAVKWSTDRPHQIAVFAEGEHCIRTE
jgi:hypothetical protein